MTSRARIGIAVAALIAGNLGLDFAIIYVRYFGYALFFFLW